MSISKSIFGQLPTGETVELYTITNKKGAFVRISPLGCAIVSVCVPDRSNLLRDVVLGYDTPEEYLSKPKYIGVVVGRYANRIAKGKFLLNGKAFQLECNSGQNAIHGGSNGFNKKLWKVAGSDEQSVTFTLDSPHGDSGYPGSLHVQLMVSFDDACALSLRYYAFSDEDTICNLTHHTYFNLNGHTTGNLTGQSIQVFANKILDVDKELIPTGEVIDVVTTNADLTQPVCFDSIHSLIGRDPLISACKGLDFCYILDGRNLKMAATAYSSESGISMEVFTDLPALQVYSGGGLGDTVFGKGGTVYPQHAGFCLETEQFPDAPNHDNFPSSVLREGQQYITETAYKFYQR